MMGQKYIFAVAFVTPVLVWSYVNAVLCPGGLIKCPDAMTCCLLANKEYGCCPYMSAVCCPDRVHCCPHDMQCDVVYQACLKNGFPVKFFWQVPVHQELTEQIEPRTVVKDLQIETNEVEVSEGLTERKKCPDEHWCPGQYTCCRMYSGDYGCCPYDAGVCCADGFHCCPKGSQCDATTGGCYHENMNFSINAYPLKSKKPPKITRTKVQTARTTPLIKPARENIADPGGKCPDGHPCQEQYTCCQVMDQGYGCCPLTDAVCCTDYIHCCPKGTTCNTTLGTCDVQKNLKLSVPAHSIVTLGLSQVSRPKAKLEAEQKDEVGVVCPDRQYRCPGGQTCCPIRSGGYGCCPMPLATCCSDREHCCPHGYECIGSACQRRAGSPDLPPFIRFSSAIRNEEASSKLTIPEVRRSMVLCPDGNHCPDGNTCCTLSSGSYGCCPMTDATCCDNDTCCPHGYWCGEDSCDRASRTSSNYLRFLSKTRISPSFADNEEDPKGVILNGD